MARPAAKIHPSALKLENSLCFRLHVLRIVNQLFEPFCSIFVREFATCSFPIVLLLTGYNPSSLLLHLLLLQLGFAELYQLALQCLAHLHLGEGLLSRAQVNVLHVAVIDESLRESGCTGRRSLRSIGSSEIVAISANATLPTF